MDFKIKLYHNEGVQNFKTEIFPNHFLLAICGKPGSGKTSLLKHLMKSNTFFFKKFDFVFIISPSVQEFKSFFLPPENLFTKLDLNFLENSINKVKQYILDNDVNYINVLIILDDCITELVELNNNKDILAFIFNRRHLLNIDGKDRGMVSIIITTQKFNKLSTSIRTCLSTFIFFKLNPMDYKILFEDIIYGDKIEFENNINLLNTTSEYSNFIIYRVDKNKYYLNFKEIN